MDAFVKLPEGDAGRRRRGRPSRASSPRLHVHGEKVTLNADLRVVDDEQFPFALLYFTGSKEHNIRLRQRAIDRGLTLNEYGLAEREEGDRRARTEADIYAALGLDYIPPELREDTGEIEAAEAHKLPGAGRRTRDIRGVFHNHTTYSDGDATLEEMALAGEEARLRVLRRRRSLAVADHRARACRRAPSASSGPRSTR